MNKSPAERENFNVVIVGHVDHGKSTVVGRLLADTGSLPQGKLEAVKRESIPTVSLYYDQGDGTRYRSLGCGPCQNPIKSTSKNVDDIITELKSGKLKNIAERSGRLQDGKHGLEELRRKGYM